MTLNRLPLCRNWSRSTLRKRGSWRRQMERSQNYFSLSTPLIQQMKGVVYMGRNSSITWGVILLQHGETFFYHMGWYSSITWGDILLSHGETIFYHWGDILLSQLKLHILFKEFYQTYSFRKFLYLRKYYFISENIIWNPLIKKFFSVIWWRISVCLNWYSIKPIH